MMKPVIAVAASVVLMSFGIINSVCCDIYGTQGKSVTYEVTLPAGAKRSNVIAMKSVTQQAGVRYTEAVCTVNDDAGKMIFVYLYKYRCDSVYFCETTYNQLHITEKEAAAPAELTTEPVMYPIALKIGDTLKPASGSKTVKNVNTSSGENVFIYNRKVEAKEAVITAAGTFNSYRITYKLSRETKSDYGPLGVIVTRVNVNGTEWYDPATGIVKREEVSETGKTSMVMTAVSR